MRKIVATTILVMLMSGMALAGTEADVKDAVKTTDCKVAYYKDRILGIFPNVTTGTVTVIGDTKQVSVSDLDKPISSVIPDFGKVYAVTNVGSIPDKVNAVRVRCPLKDGEIEVTVRKN
jgi:hypothetical protein